MLDSISSNLPLDQCESHADFSFREKSVLFSVYGGKLQPPAGWESSVH